MRGSHFTTPDAFKILTKNNYEAIRLGKLKDDIKFAEPIIRDADMMCFNLNAIRYSECPGVNNPT
ncbi:MAG: formiminoglutamase, partial [Bacteroidota bacterium]